MKTTLLLIVGIVIIAGVAGAYFLLQPQDRGTNELLPPVDLPQIDLPPVGEPLLDPAPDPAPIPDPELILDPEPGDIEGIVIRVFNFEFTPAEIEIKRGTTITWLMREIDFPQGDAGFHNVVADGGEFNSKNLRRVDETWSYTFNEIGEFSYACEPHPLMIGKIIVTE